MSARGRYHKFAEGKRKTQAFMNYVCFQVLLKTIPAVALLGQTIYHENPFTLQ